MMTHIHAAWELASDGYKITLIIDEGKPYWIIARNNCFLFTGSTPDSIMRLYNKWKSKQEPLKDKPKIYRSPIAGDPWKREHVIIPM